MNELTQLLKSRRIEKGISQSDLAKYLGCNRATVCRLEKGQRNWKLDKFIQACKYLGLEVKIK